MPEYRDIVLKRDNRLKEKQDKKQPIRAVITDSLGNASGSGDIWANRNTRKVWIRELATASVRQVVCYSITPAIGLGVMVGYKPWSNVQQVLESDTDFLGITNATGTSYEAPSNEDFLPGGRLQLWIQSKLLVPLATYPNTTGLVVNVTSGYYPYNGERKFFAGLTNVDISASQPAAGQYRFVGLYLDSSNTLQTINGTAGGTTPPAEPTWPSGAFQLSVVRLYNPQTKINLLLDTDANNDIFDRRMAWSEVFGSNVWPRPGKINIGFDEYDTLAAAVAAAVANDVIRMGEGSFTCDNVTLPSDVSLEGSGQTNTTLTQTSDANCLTSSGGRVSNLAISMTINSANNRTALIPNNSAIVENVDIVASNAGAGRCDGILSNTADDPIIHNCSTSVDGYGVLVNHASTIVTIRLGFHFGTLGDVEVTTGKVNAFYFQADNVTAYPATRGLWFDTDAFTRIEADLSYRATVGRSLGVWLEGISDSFKRFEGTGATGFSAALTAAADGDTIRLEAGTATGTFTVSDAISIIGSGTTETIINNTADTTDTVLTISHANIEIYNLKVSQTGAGLAGISHLCVLNNQTGFVMDNVSIEKTTGSSTTAIGFESTAGDSLLRNCKINVSAASVTNYSIYLLTAGSTVTIEGGEITAGTIVTSHASAVLKLQGCRLGSSVTFDTSGGGTIEGWYIDSNGLIVHLNPIAGANPAYFSILAVPPPIIISNGAINIWQRGTSFAAIGNAVYGVDRFRHGVIGAAVHTASRSTDVPTVAQAGVLANYSYYLDCTTADASIAAADATFTRYVIEGYDFLRIAQQQFTLSFWVKATKTGIYCVAFGNSGADRSYVVEYTINSADTWEYKTVTVSASPTAGTWSYTNGIGLAIYWTIASGSNYQTTANAWQTGNFIATSNQVNGTDSTNNDWRMTLFDIVPGAYARPFPIVPFQNDFDRCLRYYYKSFDYATAPAQSAGVTASISFPALAGGAATEPSGTHLLPVPMRITGGTLTTYNPSANNAQVRDVTAAADCSATALTAAEDSFYITCTGNAGTAARNQLRVHVTLDREF